MIADDHVGIRLLYKELLSVSGHDIIAEFNNGFDTLASYYQIAPDLLINDNNMEKMNGIDVVRQILYKHHQANIIICTANPDAVMTEAIHLGVREVLSTPFHMENFIESVSIALNN